MLLRWLLLLFALSVVIPQASYAADLPVTIRVTDIEGGIISTAVIRFPNEGDRHPVNMETGEWTGTSLYLKNGKEWAFEKGMMLDFEISAPGFTNKKVLYEVRKRKNLVPVALDALVLPDPMEDEEPHVQFGRDKPIDGASID